mmetsp:Transcript_98928/g.248080  ORF Transcript_98928/g.248080 Transcript_98928/m.248080 type:complete len:263 (-) Transcript_98928:203-991(-)
MSFQDRPKRTMFEGLMSKCTKPAACRPHTMDTSDHWMCLSSSTARDVPSSAKCSKRSSSVSAPSSNTIHNFSISMSMPGALACSECAMSCTKHLLKSMLLRADAKDTGDIGSWSSDPEPVAVHPESSRGRKQHRGWLLAQSASSSLVVNDGFRSALLLPKLPCVALLPSGLAAPPIPPGDFGEVGDVGSAAEDSASDGHTESQLASFKLCMVLMVSSKCRTDGSHSLSPRPALYILTATSRLVILSKPLHTRANAPSPSTRS